MYDTEREREREREREGVRALCTKPSFFSHSNVVSATASSRALARTEASGKARMKKCSARGADIEGFIENRTANEATKLVDSSRPLPFPFLPRTVLSLLPSSRSPPRSRLSRAPSWRQSSHRSEARGDLLPSFPRRTAPRCAAGHANII